MGYNAQPQLFHAGLSQMCYNTTDCVGEPVYNGTAEDCCALSGRSILNDSNCTELQCSGIIIIPTWINMFAFLIGTNVGL